MQGYGPVKPLQRSGYRLLSPLDPGCHCPGLNLVFLFIHLSQDLISSPFSPLHCNHSPWGSVSLCVFVWLHMHQFFQAILSPPFIRSRQHPSGLPWQLRKLHISPSCFRLTMIFFLYSTPLLNIKSSLCHSARSLTEHDGLKLCQLADLYIVLNTFSWESLQTWENALYITTMPSIFHNIQIWFSSQLH